MEHVVQVIKVLTFGFCAVSLVILANQCQVILPTELRKKSAPY